MKNLYAGNPDPENILVFQIIFIIIITRAARPISDIFTGRLYLLLILLKKKYKLDLLKVDQQVKEELEKLKLMFLLPLGQGIMSSIYQFNKVISEEKILVRRQLEKSFLFN